jgi:hypothetical protein
MVQGSFVGGFTGGECWGDCDFSLEIANAGPDELAVEMHTKLAREEVWIEDDRAVHDCEEWR